MQMDEDFDLMEDESCIIWGEYCENKETSFCLTVKSFNNPSTCAWAKALTNFSIGSARYSSTAGHASVLKSFL